MTRATDAAKALQRAQRDRLRADPHAATFAELDVDYLYHLAVKRMADLATAITARGETDAPIDEAYLAGVASASADAANAVAYLLARVTPKGGRIRVSSEAIVEAARGQDDAQ